MIDHEFRRQAREHRFMLRQRVAIELKIDVPAERRDARGHRFECVPRQHAACEHHKAHAANAGLMQAMKFVIRNIWRNDGDAARAIAQLRDGGKRAAIIESVTRRLHDDRA